MKMPHLILCFVILFVFSFCNKKRERGPENIPPVKIIYVSNELKEWGLFNAGTYWVYRDSLTGAEDSLYVNSVVSKHIKQFSTSDTNIVAEAIYIYTNNLPESFFILCSYPYDQISMKAYTFTDGSSGYEPVFSIDSTKLSLPEGINKNNSISNVSVLGNNYNDVRYTYSMYSHSFQSTGTYYFSFRNYFKKNIGLVKLLSNIPLRNKELLRHHIIQ